MKQLFCRFASFFHLFSKYFSHFHAAGTQSLKVTCLTNSYCLLGICHVTGAGPHAALTPVTSPRGRQCLFHRRGDGGSEQLSSLPRVAGCEAAEPGLGTRSD